MVRGLLQFPNAIKLSIRVFFSKLNSGWLVDCLKVFDGGLYYILYLVYYVWYLDQFEMAKKQHTTYQKWYTR